MPPFMPGFGELLLRNVGIDDLAGESDKRLDVGITFLADIFVDFQLMAHGVQARGGDDHGLGTATDLVLGEGAEVLDNHLDLLAQVVGVEREEPSQRFCSFALRHIRIISDRFDEAEIGLVGRVVGQHVQDEPFLDRLAHAVQVKG